MWTSKSSLLQVLISIQGMYFSIKCVHESSTKSNIECSYTDPPGRDISPSRVPSLQCLYSFADEYTEAVWGELNCLSFKIERCSVWLSIELTVLESCVQHLNHWVMAATPVMQQCSILNTNKSHAVGIAAGRNLSNN